MDTRMGEGVISSDLRMDGRVRSTLEEVAVVVAATTVAVSGGRVVWEVSEGTAMVVAAAVAAAKEVSVGAAVEGVAPIVAAREEVEKFMVID